MLLTVLLHCHCQYNINHDSHRVHLHCRHQIQHTRELKLKSYTIVFHIISNQISTTWANNRKNKHDKNDQSWLNTSTTLQKRKCWFKFFHLVFVLFLLINWLGRECVCTFYITISCYLSSAMVDWCKLASVSGLFLGHRAHTMKHCRARWQSLVWWWWWGWMWVGDCIAGPHGTNNPNTQSHGLFSTQTHRNTDRKTGSWGVDGDFMCVSICVGLR